ncbi:MAG: hypothetical protein HIU83_03275 [Proteobacteria bacterium]|nr:hypothetical protein [Pseudomonadota bacterium]
MNYLNMIAVTIGLLLMACPAPADEVVITYRSGKVQTIPVNDTTDPVEQVSYRKTEKAAPNALPGSQNIPVRSPSPSTETKTPQPEQEKASTQKAPQPVKNSDTPNVKFKWAQPIDAQ